MMLNTKVYPKVLLMSVIVTLLLIFAIPAMAAPGAHELITPDQLSGLIHSNNAIIIDVRDVSAYNAGHITGAVNVNMQEFYETVNGVKSQAATPEKLAGLLSRIGATPQTRIVAYSANNDAKHPDRVMWVLNALYGHKNAQMLDGGFQAWVVNGYEVSTEPVTPTPAVYPASELIANPNAVATLEEVKDALSQESGTVVIDCRNMDYYTGKLSKVARPGHISGTILVPEMDMYNPDYTLKDKKTLTDYFEAIGITKEISVIVYCNTGTTATVQYLALKNVVGCKDVQNYDGSLTEWAADPALPMETGY